MSSGRMDAIAAGLPGRMAAADVPSLSVAVARDGEIIWEQGFGAADREAGLPATAQTPYALASVSKPITATALMLLVERGLVDLDRPINDYLADVPLVARVGRSEEATVRRIAAHNGGLPTHCHFFYRDEPSVPPPFAETVRRYGKIMLPPGERYCYSNLGYGLIDQVITRVSGKPFADFMREQVFEPLGMETAVVSGGPEAGPMRAARYSPTRERLPDYDFDHTGGSAVWCSAHDLVHFAMLHLGQHLPSRQRLLSAAAIVAMQKPVVAINERRGYGLGWALEPDAYGYRVVEHGGSMGGVSTRLRLLPDAGIAVAVLCNTQTELHTEVMHEVIGAILPQYAASRQWTMSETAPAVSPRPLAPSPDLVGAWSGAVETYAGDMPLRLDIRPDGDAHARLGEQPETLLDGAMLQGGRLSGRMMGDLGTDDTRDTHMLSLELRCSSDSLAGPLGASALPWEVRGRMRHWLSFWTHLSRA